jgi:dTDP-4-dehydrorhamnose 3,5-epimerase
VKFTETRLKGAFLVTPEPIEDERGFFARAFCRKEFDAHGLNPAMAQCNISFNHATGTLRGMHYQAPPFAETKLVRCTMGSICDAIVDIRRDSPTFGQWIAVELSARNRNMLYVPEGFAHGYLTLEDNTEVFYQVSQFYSREHERGFRWNDPTFSIEWPMSPRVISPKDRSYADFAR